jgi:hypothetical protein
VIYYFSNISRLSDSHTTNKIHSSL